MKKSTFNPFRGLKQRSAIALMATFVSLCALGVSLYQAQLSRRQQLAVVWPYLSVGGYGTADGTHQSWGIRVTNNGLGPAIIESAQVRLDGQTFDFQTFMDSLYRQNARLDSLKTLNYTMNEIDLGKVIPAGGDLDWFTFDLHFSKNPSVREPASSVFLKKIQLFIRYKSLYGERWESCFNCPDGAEPVRKIE